MEGLFTVDFEAWREDRLELRRLRSLETGLSVEVTAFAMALQAQAAKIQTACDMLDHMAGDLNRAGR